MKITVNRDSLLKALDVVGNALGGKVINDSHNHVLFDVKGTKCYIYARNSKMQIRAFLMVEAKGEFKFCIPGQRITETVRLLKAEKVILTTKEQENGSLITTLTIKGKKNRYKNSGINPDELGLMKLGEDAKGFKLHMDSLVREFANAQQPVQPGNLVQPLSGINVSSDGNNMRITGANNSFLYRGLLGGDNVDINMTIPKSVALAVATMPISPEAKLGTDGRHVVIKAGSVQITAILIDGKYPNTDQFFDLYKDDNYIVVNRQEMIKSMKVLRLYSTTEHKSMLVTVGKDEILLSGRNDAMTSSAEESIEIENNNVEEDFKIVFNPAIVLPALSNIESDSIKIHLISHDKFAFFTGVSEEETGLWIVMPILLSEKS